MTEARCTPVWHLPCKQKHCSKRLETIVKNTAEEKRIKKIHNWKQGPEFEENMSLADELLADLEEDEHDDADLDELIKGKA